MVFSFFDAIPAPDIISLNAVGLDLSDCAIKMMALLRTNGELRPLFWVEELLPPGIIKNGVVKEPVLLGDRLKVLFEKYHVSHVAVSVPDEQGYLVRFNVPALTPHDVEAGVELLLDEHVPLALAEALYDFEIVRKIEGKDEYEVAVGVLPRIVVDGYLSALRPTGVSVLSLEIEAQATVRAVIGAGDTTNTLVVDFGRVRTGLAIVGSGFVGFSSVVPLGGQSLTNVIAKEYGMTLEDAEHLKDMTGLYHAEGSKDLYPVLIVPVASLKDEIVRYISFWKSRSIASGDAGTIKRVLLTGGSSNLLGLADYLSHGLGVPVEVADPWHHAFSPENHIPEISLTESRSYTTAIGLALRQFNESYYRTHVI